MLFEIFCLILGSKGIDKEPRTKDVLGSVCFTRYFEGANPLSQMRLSLSVTQIAAATAWDNAMVSSLRKPRCASSTYCMRTGLAKPHQGIVSKVFTCTAGASQFVLYCYLVPKGLLFSSIAHSSESDAPVFLLYFLLVAERESVAAMPTRPTDRFRVGSLLLGFDVCVPSEQTDPCKPTP